MSKITSSTKTATNDVAAEDRYIPRKLRDALESLRDTTDNHIADCMSNELAESYRATTAAIAECREILCEIEVSMRDHLERTLQWHRACVAEVEALELSPFESEVTA